MKNEFETRDITVEDYLHARKLMFEERCSVWWQYENLNFENDMLADLVQAYDLVIDILTCLAMELDKKSNE